MEKRRESEKLTFAFHSKFSRAKKIINKLAILQYPIFVSNG